MEKFFILFFALLLFDILLMRWRGYFYVEIESRHSYNHINRVLAGVGGWFWWNFLVIFRRFCRKSTILLS